ncbi:MULTISPECIES: hypothetical protein [unclassified Mesorhizobium]|nr:MULTISPECIES: hypothetical protein [unclassified Mesorhizobium]
MHINTKRLELELSRYSLFVGIMMRKGRWETFRDWSGQGLSSTSWTAKA